MNLRASCWPASTTTAGRAAATTGTASRSPPTVGGIDFGFRNPFAALWGTVKDGVLILTGEHYLRERPLSHHAGYLPRGVMWPRPGLRPFSFGKCAAREGLHPGLPLCHPSRGSVVAPRLLEPRRGGTMVAPGGAPLWLILPCGPRAEPGESCGPVSPLRNSRRTCADRSPNTCDSPTI